MNKIKELIQQFCPEGVEFKKLGDCALIKRGRRVTKEELSPEKKYPVYSGGVTPMGYFEKHNQPANTITVVKYGTAGFVNFITEVFWANDVCYCIVPCELLDNKFLFYFLKSQQEIIQSQATNAIPAHLPTEVINRIQIPLPPLLFQQEIVSILDKFTSLEAELEAELEARTRQYEFYRNQLLTPIEVSDKWLMNGVEVEWKTLGEVCKFIRGPFGGAIKKDCFMASGYAVYEQQHAIYGNTDIRYFISDEKYKELRRFEVVPGDLIMSCSGTMGKIAIIPDNAPKGVINQALLKLTVKKEIGAKYLKYYFENTITQQMNEGAKGGAIKNVASVDVLKKIQIPIPPLSEQNRIVEVLDKFDALVNDISVGLPAEIQARRKQYEYYRGKLLDFKPLNH